jgi:6-phosphogluconate dehydrogenase
MMLVKAGQPVDDLMEQMIPFMESGDIMIDGGNSYFPDTIRRTRYAEEKGFLYIGTGVSGGEDGALKGPSIMPGGSNKAWEEIKPLFQSIAAKVDGGVPCCDWVGEDGAGHFVKMVHNGIEYGDMQLICECYHIMRDMLGMNCEEMHNVFAEWNKGDLDSYLIEITRDILAFKNSHGEYLVDRILDAAGQKGTGKWTGIEALELGVPLTLIVEAVFARSLSAFKDERVKASKILARKTQHFKGDRKSLVNDLGSALFAAKIVSYAQGYSLMHAAAAEYNWSLNYGGIALMWRGGCIIRSAFLSKISEAYNHDTSLHNLLLVPYFANKVMLSQEGWRRVVASAVMHGIPTPALSSALAYFDGYRCARLPANLLQAQRDFFGAHNYERIDKPRGMFFHTNWTGRGGDTASSSYNV